jgi:cell division protein ZipA
MSLRVVLILVGIVIIAGVYFVTAVKRRRESRANYDRTFSRLDVPDVILQHDDELYAEQDRDLELPPGFEADDEPLAELSAPEKFADEAPAPATRPEEAAEHPPAFSSSALPSNVILPPEEIALGDLPRVRNDIVETTEPSNDRRSSDQMDMFGATSDSVTASPTAVAATAQDVDEEPDNGLINLFIRAREGHQLAGPSLVRSLNAVGMVHGEMAIFHHFGSGELRTEQALFSAANMFEPGTFDLTRIEAFNTSGIALFMQLPTVLDGAVAFELLLNTAQRLAELCGGELYESPQYPLDASHIAVLRKRAAKFNHGRN